MLLLWNWREYFMVSLHDEVEPKTVHETFSCPHCEKWISIMDYEMDYMIKKSCLDLIDLPPGHDTIRNTWIFIIKCKANRTIDRPKAHLVTKCYPWEERVDYEETFSLVVKFTLVCLMSAIVVHFDLELHQMNVKIAFLNRDLD